MEKAMVLSFRCVTRDLGGAFSLLTRSSRPARCVAAFLPPDNIDKLTKTQPLHLGCGIPRYSPLSIRYFPVSKNAWPRGL